MPIYKTIQFKNSDKVIRLFSHVIDEFPKIHLHPDIYRIDLYKDEMEKIQEAIQIGFDTTKNHGGMILFYLSNYHSYVQSSGSCFQYYMQSYSEKAALRELRSLLDKPDKRYR